MIIVRSGPGDILPGKLTIEPLKADNWDSLVRLFGDRGACGNCWCMYYRLSNPDFKEGKQKGGNREALYSLSPGAPLHPGNIFPGLRNHVFTNASITFLCGRSLVFLLTRDSGTGGFLLPC